MSTSSQPLPAGKRVLMDMLTFKRPAWSETEEQFIDRFLMPLSGIERDPHGNLWLSIDNPDGTPSPILWSCHTDTVHHEGGRQAVQRDGYGMVSLRDPRIGTCLGADDAAGVWLLREMILAGVPGLYIFHRDEERGASGSRWIKEHAKDELADIKFAIAFDRAGYGDVITHQGAGKTASNAFAHSVATILGGAFKPDDTGVFTDTEVYAGIIPECSNISVGYFNQHGPRETLDVPFLLALRDTVVAADWSSLVAAREPGDDGWDEQARGYERWLGQRYGGGWVESSDGWDTYETERERSGDATAGWGYGSLLRFVRDNPEVTADYLETLGITAMDLQQHADNPTVGPF